MTVSDIVFLKDDNRKDEYVCMGMKQIGTVIHFILMNSRTKRKKLLAKNKINDLILPEITSLSKKKEENDNLRDVIRDMSSPSGDDEATSRRDVGDIHEREEREIR